MPGSPSCVIYVLSSMYGFRGDAVLRMNHRPPSYSALVSRALLTVVLPQLTLESLYLQPPAVCSFQDAHYQVTVYRAGSSDPVYEGEPQPINNSDQVVEAEISSVFQANSPYYAIVTFVTHSKHISANTSFSKC